LFLVGVQYARQKCNIVLKEAALARQNISLGTGAILLTNKQPKRLHNRLNLAWLEDKEQEDTRG
jgi:hypothetical protein